MTQLLEEQCMGADPYRNHDVIAIGPKSGTLPLTGRRTTSSELARRLYLDFQIPVSRAAVHRIMQKGSRAARNPRVRPYAIVKARFQRARKTWNCKANCDPKHCSTDYSIHDFCARNLEVIVINMDDAAQFMLDSVSSHKQQGVLASSAKPIAIERTNYVTSYNAHIQVTSHLVTYFVEKSGVLEKQFLPIGFVKPNYLHAKNPFQHTLDTIQIFKLYGGCFGARQIMMWQHDRGPDCGPDKPVVRLMAGFLCFKLQFSALFVTSRQSGGSYLNPVERMNGALKLAESHFFIPSTLLCPIDKPGMGPWHKRIGGKDDLFRNLNEARRVYIDRVNGAPFMGSRIQLQNGCDSSHSTFVSDKGVRIDLLDDQVQTMLTTFAKVQFSHFIKHPDATKCTGITSKTNPVVIFFASIMEMIVRHEIKTERLHNTAQYKYKYYFGLALCCMPECIHPVCKQYAERGETYDETWFPGGPRIRDRLYPVRDPDVIVGSDCPRCCPNKCMGHHLLGEAAIRRQMSHPDTRLFWPPSEQIYVSTLAYENTKKPEDHDRLPRPDILALARQCLLSEEDTTMFVEHYTAIIRNRRLRGKSKRSKSRQKGIVYKCISGISCWQGIFLWTGLEFIFETNHLRPKKSKNLLGKKADL